MKGYTWITACLNDGGSIVLDEGDFYAYNYDRERWHTKHYLTRREAAQEYCKHFNLEFEARVLWEVRNAEV